MRGLVHVVGALAGVVLAVATGACTDDAFACQSDDACSGGACHEGFCAFPDGDCESGLRWGPHAESFSQMCVPADGNGTVASSGPAPMTTALLDTGADSSGGPSETTTTDSGPALTSGPSTSDGPGSSDGTTGATGIVPLSWWRLDDGAGNLASDAGSLGVDGLLQGGVGWVDGQLEGAAEFDGVDAFIEVVPHPEYQLQTQLTVSAWVRVAAPSPVAHPLIVGMTGGYALRLNGTTTQIALHFSDPDADQINAFGNVNCDGEALPLDTWVHVAATYDVADRTMRVYAGGQPTCSLTTTGGDGSISASDDVLMIGRWDVGSTAHFNGRIDDVRIYDVALSPAEISELATR